MLEDFRLSQRKGKLPIIIKKVKSRLRRVIAKLAISAYNYKSIIATEVPFSHSRSHIESWSIQSVLQRFTDVFMEGLGTLKGYEAKIHINPHVVPRFCMPRTLPYALRARVEDELERLVELGVVQFAD